MGESVFSKYMTRPAGYLMFFFCGILAGVAVVQVQNSAALAGIFSEYFLNQYANLRIDSGKLLSYVGRYRCGQYFLAVCCGVLPVAPAVFAGLVFLLGMAWGTALSISAVRLGLAGILICAAGIFPQFFFYLPAFGWGSSVDHVWRKEPEKIFLPDSGRIFFPVIWDRDGSRRQSAYFAAGSQKNILKLLKFQPFSAILVPQRTQRDIENVRADRKFPERGIFLQTRACYGL